MLSDKARDTMFRYRPPCSVVIHTPRNKIIIMYIIILPWAAVAVVVCKSGRVAATRKCQIYNTRIIIIIIIF